MASLDVPAAPAIESEEPLDELEIPDDPRAAADAVYALGLSDGLPIIPPTRDRVDQMLGACGLSGGEVLGRMPPRYGLVTSTGLAINAVMAGCPESTFPALIAIVQALLVEEFNLLGAQSTTHPCTCMAIVNGPVRYRMKMNLSSNAMGDSNQASATLGRAVRFVLRSLGGAIPGVTDLATQGTPARAGFVFGECEEVSPFPPFHTTRGLAAHDSAVTVFAAEGPHNVNDHASATGTGFLAALAGSMATLCTNDLGRQRAYPVVALGPEHAAMVARDGYTRETIQAFLFERARVHPDRLPPEMRVWFEMRDDIDRGTWTAAGIPIAQAPEHINVIVAGGPGKHSSYIPTFGYCVPVTRAVQLQNPIVCDC